MRVKLSVPVLFDCTVSPFIADTVVSISNWGVVVTSSGCGVVTMVFSGQEELLQKVSSAR